MTNLQTIETHTTPKYEIAPLSIVQHNTAEQANTSKSLPTDEHLRTIAIEIGLVKFELNGLICLSLFLYGSMDRRNQWIEGNDNLRIETGYGLEQYYLNDDGTYRYEEAIMTIDSAVQMGVRFDTFLKTLRSA